mgnify:CR=1 FL=1
MKNGGKQVAKATPEEMAIIQNISALMNELQAMTAGDAMAIPGDPSTLNPFGGMPMQGAPMGFSQNEDQAAGQDDEGFDFEPEPESEPELEPEDDDEGAAPAPARRPNMTAKTFKSEDPNAPGMVKPGDPENKLAVKKEEGQSTSEGVTAEDDAEEHLYDDLPETTKENVQEIEKALAPLGLSIVKAKPKSPVARIEKSIANLQSQVGFLANTLQEVIEGLTVAKSADADSVNGGAPAETSVRKAAALPDQNYPGQDLASVLKSLLDERDAKAQEASVNMNPWNRGEVVHKSMKGLTSALGDIARTWHG